MTNARSIILFDGVCNLCNSTVQFLLKRDKQDHFLFASLQSETGQELLLKFDLPGSTFNSIILVEGDAIFTESTAVLRMVYHLSGGWHLLYAFIVFPRFIRDRVYRIVSKNRYRLFGKQEACLIPTPELKKKFLK